LRGIESQLPRQFWVHRDAAAQRAARLLNVPAFARGNRIFLGDDPLAGSEAVLRHELVHLAQVERSARTGRIASRAAAEREAALLGALPAALPVLHGADGDSLHPFLWFVAIGVGLYVLLRPGVANAPGPRDKPIRGPSPGQIIAEALCLFV